VGCRPGPTLPHLLIGRPGWCGREPASGLARAREATTSRRPTARGCGGRVVIAPDRIAHRGGGVRISGQFEGKALVRHPGSLHRAQRLAGWPRSSSGPMRPLACRLTKRQPDQAVDQRAGANGDRLGLPMSSHPGRSRHRVSRSGEPAAGLRNRGAEFPIFLSNKTSQNVINLP